jgi:DNA-binding winged helix-turn-helix (wHTH) protein/tetratricopeptide (TPR) repeat protein
LDDRLPLSGRRDAPGRINAATPGVSLAHRADFRLAAATIRPSVRTVDGPEGSRVLEPRVMQVLLAFADAQGAVLTRDELMLSCWNGAVVSDDAVNRTVAEIRRIARATGSGFGIETISRVGYRLTIARSNTPAPLAGAGAQKYSRRWLIGATALATAAAAAGLWRVYGNRPDPRFSTAMEQGRQALKRDTPGSFREATQAFREAIVIHPDDASAWGLLALALHFSSNALGSLEAGAAIAESERAAQRALSIDGKEPNALLTMALLLRRFEDWLTTENRFREVLAIDPRNAAGLGYMVSQLQAAGYVGESWDYNERAIALGPLSPTLQSRRALKLWILDRWDEADQVATYAQEAWPQHPQVLNARLVVSAFTGRWKAAHQVLEGQRLQGTLLSPSGVTMWLAGVKALETRTPSDIAAAREASLAAAPQNPGSSAYATSLQAALGEVDAAYSIVEGFMLRRGLIVTQDRRVATGSEFEVDLGWRSTQWLFTPAMKSMRDDPRFELLSGAIGLSQYWQSRGVPPDERRAAG